MTTTTSDDSSASAASAASDSTAAPAPAPSTTDSPPAASTTTYVTSGPQTVTEFPQNADEFCSSLSANDKRVELISAFHATEIAAGRRRDVPSAYAARFKAFINQAA